MLFYYDSDGNVKVLSITNLPDQYQIAGLCLNTVTEGGTAKILVNGYGTARITSVPLPSSATVTLNNITNGTTQGMTNSTIFTDSGGTGANYASNENYSITFDAGAGRSIHMDIIDFAFEHGTSSMYDIFGIQGSTNGTQFFNLNVPWFQNSVTATPPYSTSFKKVNWDSSGSKPGYILPRDKSRAISLGTSSFPVAVLTQYRFLKFFFFSDVRSKLSGWQIKLYPSTPYPSGTIPFTPGATLYIDNTDYTKLSENNTSQRSIGVVAYSDSSNNSVFCHINPFLRL